MQLYKSFDIFETHLYNNILLKQCLNSPPFKKKSDMFDS